MKTLLTTGWNFMRILRLALGALVIFFAVRDHDMLTGIVGGFLMLTAAFNTGCCGMGACEVPQNRSAQKNTVTGPETITCEEVK